MTVELGLGETDLEWDPFTYIQLNIHTCTFHWYNICLSMDEYETSVSFITSPLGEPFTSLLLLFPTPELQCIHQGFSFAERKCHTITCVSTIFWHSGHKMLHHQHLVPRAEKLHHLLLSDLKIQINQLPRNYLFLEADLIAAVRTLPLGIENFTS